jgi:hypothetical protein
LLSFVVLTCAEVRSLPISTRSKRIYAVQAAFACIFECFGSECVPPCLPGHIPATLSACERETTRQIRHLTCTSQDDFSCLQHHPHLRGRCFGTQCCAVVRHELHSFAQPTTPVLYLYARETLVSLVASILKIQVASEIPAWLCCATFRRTMAPVVPWNNLRHPFSTCMVIKRCLEQESGRPNTAAVPSGEVLIDACGRSSRLQRAFGWSRGSCYCQACPSACI